MDFVLNIDFSRQWVIMTKLEATVHCLLLRADYIPTYYVIEMINAISLHTHNKMLLQLLWVATGFSVNVMHLKLLPFERI